MMLIFTYIRFYSHLIAHKTIKIFQTDNLPFHLVYFHLKIKRNSYVTWPLFWISSLSMKRRKPHVTLPFWLRRTAAYEYPRKSTTLIKRNLDILLRFSTRCFFEKSQRFSVICVLYYTQNTGECDVTCRRSTLYLHRRAKSHTHFRIQLSVYCHPVRKCLLSLTKK